MKPWSASLQFALGLPLGATSTNWPQLAPHAGAVSLGSKENLALKGPRVATRKQEEAIQAALLAALRVRNGKTVIGDGMPAKWKLKEPQS
jgi:hypothetical protein